MLEAYLIKREDFSKLYNNEFGDILHAGWFQVGKRGPGEEKNVAAKLGGSEWTRVTTTT